MLCDRPHQALLRAAIFEQLGGTYHEENGYLIPDLRLPTEEEQPIGTWGQRHLDYLKQYRKVTYTIFSQAANSTLTLLTLTGQAQKRFERLIEGMKQAQGITEQLKVENALSIKIGGQGFNTLRSILL